MPLSAGAAEAPAAAANRMKIVRFFPKLLIEKEEELRIQKTGLLLRIYENSLHCARECVRAEHRSGTELNCQICSGSFSISRLNAIYWVLTKVKT